jgi:O-antigen ligase
MASRFAFKTYEKILLYFCLLLLLIMEFFAYSRAAWISLIGSCIFYCLLTIRIKFYQVIFLLVVISIGFYAAKDSLYQYAKENDAVSNKGEVGEHFMSVTNVSTDASNLERINRWSCAIRMSKVKPITGFGPGTYQFQYGPFQAMDEITYISTLTGDRGNAHSEPLTYLSESGWPGFVLFVVWVLVSLYYGMRAFYRAADPWVKYSALAALLGLVTFYIHGLVNSFLDQVKIAPLVFGSIAIFIAIDVYHLNKIKQGVESQDSKNN